MGTEVKEEKRLKRHRRVRRKVVGTGERPRLCVHRSGKNIQCQIVDDSNQASVATFSTLDKKFQSISKKGNKVEAAKSFGKFVSDELKAKSISKIAFDRAGYLYHGRVKAFADALREGGISF
jgi:large subunit ribosomal protein L18